MVVVKGLRVAHLTATFPPYFGGTGMVCFHHAEQLARAGCQVTVFTPQMAGASGVDVGYRFSIRRLPALLRAGNAALLPQLLGLLNGFDIIHLHYPFIGGEAAALAAWKNRTPLVVTYHQDLILSGWRDSIARLVWWSIGRTILEHAARIVFTSEDYASSSKAYRLFKGLDRPIRILPNGVDEQFFSPGPTRTDIYERYQLGDGSLVVLMVASLDRAHYFKGVDVLLQALGELPGHVRALIVGDGDLRSHYQSRARSLGVDWKTRFTGRVPMDDLPHTYRLADVTVLPSVTRGEAFGLVLLESLACGTPVIASNLPGVRSLVDHGKDGLLVEPGSKEDLRDKLDCLLGLPGYRRLEWGDAGRKKVVERYTWDRIGEQLVKIYEEVVQ